MAEGNGKLYTRAELEERLENADRDTRIEERLNWIMYRLDDPDLGCPACRKEIKEVKAQAEATEKKVDRIIYIGGTVFTAFTLFGRDALSWFLGTARGGP